MSTLPLRALLALAVILLVAAGGTTSASGNAEHTLASTWSGQWASEWGTMQLTQSGSALTGTYPHDQGHIAGTISGNVFTGRWDEAPTRAGPGDAGAAVFTLSTDSKSFTGRWNYDGSPTQWGTDWNGHCVGGACAAVTPSLAPKPPAAEVKAAVAWTRGQLGTSKWAGKCQRFVEASYGARTGYKSAAEAAAKIGLRQGSVSAVPRGALIYFDANCPGVTGSNGHVGISLGNGQMISSLGKVKITNLKTSAGWRKAYSGWTYPPAKWPGRRP